MPTMCKAMIQSAGKGQVSNMIPPSGSFKFYGEVKRAQIITTNNSTSKYFMNGTNITEKEAGMTLTFFFAKIQNTFRSQSCFYLASLLH